MKLSIFLSFIIFGSFFSISSETDVMMLQVYITSEEVDSTLAEDEAVFQFHFEGLLERDSNRVVFYSIDSIEYEASMQGADFEVKTTPGMHTFMIYINSNYYEVITGGLPIASQHHDTYTVQLSYRPRHEEIITYKPVIYLYPEVETDVSISLDIYGKNPFYYPAYTDGWNVTAHPDGQLTINDEQYRYLFWEATQADHLSSIDLNEGFMVEGANATSFLESKLKAVGLTSEERADFITFWGPKIAANDLNVVRFEWNETCDKFATLNISPTPDHVYRLYIFTAPIETPLDLTPQALPTFNRKGFTAIEWGGQQSRINAPSL